ncbi:hypothetical protein CY34DRAFT_805257 [Suillus luteus UH-Slu-Lm8-n1]|uniref:Unplaced genomic scaffold CY34scaffold_116, whole genome shotgun sequence n=1 Tax=Suillus luteus UH-Slu-Lm8-n1 TaxID=930992 RepID=A0A0C9ZWE0_9AGAM|nr:hypothetical protein CY34DRAFT_805257 [Suillus luteus UH-Slu-Lm8-n1]
MTVQPQRLEVWHCMLSNIWGSRYERIGPALSFADFMAWNEKPGEQRTYPHHRSESAHFGCVNTLASSMHAISLRTEGDCVCYMKSLWEGMDISSTCFRPALRLPLWSPSCIRCTTSENGTMNRTSFGFAAIPR